MILLKKLVCWMLGHKVQMIDDQQEFDLVHIHKCTRCKQTLNTETDKFNVRCTIGKKTRWSRLIKENTKTIVVSFNGNLIKRHKNKHDVIMRKA